MAVSAARNEAGFSVIEVMIAAALFVAVALAGFETVRELGSAASVVGLRDGAAATFTAAVGQMRSDAISAAAVWVPSGACGAAVSMLQENAAGTSFTTYVARNGSLVRATAAGPIDPCGSSLHLQRMLAGVTAWTTVALAANALAAHVDPIAGELDGGLFRSAMIPTVAVDTHVRDYDGSPITGGNGIVEVTLDADPAEATIDLLAGNRPSGYTQILTYACGARCAANTLFPEIASLRAETCTAGTPDLPDTGAFYTPSATAVGAAGRIVTAAYAIHLRYGFTFGAALAPLTVYRLGPTFVWPAAANLRDAYPADYANNSVRSAGAAALALAAGPPANLAAGDAVCDAMNAELDYGG